MSNEEEHEQQEQIRNFYLACDPAKEHDYFGIALLERINEKSIRLTALKERQLDYAEVAKYIESLYKKYQVRKIFLDQTGIGNVFIDMLKQKHLLVEGVKLSNPKKVEIIETVVRLIQEGRLKIPKSDGRAEELINEGWKFVAALQNGRVIVEK